MKGSRLVIWNRPRFHVSLIIICFVLDQLTKWWARAAYSLPNGEPDYFKTTEILGDFLKFRLVYNEGAAFGMRPQELLPFLHPTLFFALISFVAIAGLIWFYVKKIPASDLPSRLGVTFILAGAFGNLTDRLVLHKVTDFIDVDFFDIDWTILGREIVMYRWPTFNLADSWVSIGVVLMLISPWLIQSPAHVAERDGVSDADASGNHVESG